MRIEKDFKEFIELLNKNKVKYLIVGVEFENAWMNKVEGKYGDIPCFFISKEDLIKNKQAAARPQDLADIKSLGKYGPTSLK